MDFVVFIQPESLPFVIARSGATWQSHKTGCQTRQITPRLARFHLGEVSPWVSPLATRAMTEKYDRHKARVKSLQKTVGAPFPAFHIACSKH